MKSLGQRPRLSLAQTSLAVKKTTRTSGGDLISLIDIMQQSIETHVIRLLNLVVGNAEYSFYFYLQIKDLKICDCVGLFYFQTTWLKM